MSWDSYIDNLIAQTKDASGAAHADKACIIVIDGGAKWTTDGHASALKVQALVRQWYSLRSSVCIRARACVCYFCSYQRLKRLTLPGVSRVKTSLRSRPAVSGPRV